MGPNSSFTSTKAQCQLLSQGWPLGQVAEGAAPFRPRVAYLLRRVVAGWAVACAVLGFQSHVYSQSWLGHTDAGGHASVRCSLEPALRGQELRLLCQELRRRWSWAETSSPTARRQASQEVEFTCWQIRASPARPRGQAPSSSFLCSSTTSRGAELRPNRPSRLPAGSLAPRESSDVWLTALLLQGDK